MKYFPPKSNLFHLIQRKKPIKNILLYAQAYLPSGEKIILIKGGGNDFSRKLTPMFQMARKRRNCLKNAKSATMLVPVNST